MTPVFAYLLALVCGLRLVGAAELTRITVGVGKLRQEFQGLGCGAIFYEGHITSLAARGKHERQRELYDDMFAKVPTRYLQLMIRHNHEPQNDNADPWTPAFDAANFKYCEHTLAIAKAATKRRPDIQLLATLYTPPPWMKTNNAVGGGGEARATLKPNHELELAEFLWAFVAHMARNGAPIEYLAIANEPDWPHKQPSYFLTAEQHAELFRRVALYLDRMGQRSSDVRKPKLVGPNTLSAPGAARRYVPALLRRSASHLDVIASHDYDRRGNRWQALQKIAHGRPVWLSEWCSRGEDETPGQIKAAIEYGLAMHETFAGGANVFMAYDWVYPRRNAGEALIHVEWGNDYTLKKPYWIFRQWAEPLVPGMRVVETSTRGPGATGPGREGVKPTAFLSIDGRTLVIHVVNAQDRGALIKLAPSGRFSRMAQAGRRRTSAAEDNVELPPLTRGSRGLLDRLPPRSVVTYRFDRQ